ncbi:Rho termination factor N-terminal domain-containing protein [Picosynechococcus sp. NKBG042902]|uniref:Rho termination factor N-terminal domain-containing protein n=1 Tax=Picosynechococcus sp. NKBG042902 TaxID=490193 RepID=UPI0004AB37B3|nr:Rho termination factor N-terminal domain-containing protein [Picosynechococcus sp. NKBG042902]
MTLIITATVTAAAVYFIASLVCFIHDCIQARRHVTPPVPKPAPVTVAKEKAQPTTLQNPIETMNIRQLKKAASQAGIKGYSNMRKHELIAALA